MDGNAKQSNFIGGNLAKSNLNAWQIESLYWFYQPQIIESLAKITLIINTLN